MVMNVSKPYLRSMAHAARAAPLQGGYSARRRRQRKQQRLLRRRKPPRRCVAGWAAACVARRRGAPAASAVRCCRQRRAYASPVQGLLQPASAAVHEEAGLQSHCQAALLLACPVPAWLLLLLAIWRLHVTGPLADLSLHAAV